MPSAENFRKQNIMAQVREIKHYDGHLYQMKMIREIMRETFTELEAIAKLAVVDLENEFDARPRCLR